jgi:hypothetical protein
MYRNFGTALLLMPGIFWSRKRRASRNSMTRRKTT